MRKTHRLEDGTKLVTSSNCRYVLFRLYDDGPVILKRSDNVSRLIALRTGRDVIVDFNAQDGSRVVPATTVVNRRWNDSKRKWEYVR